MLEKKELYDSIKAEAINDLISFLRYESILDEYKPNDEAPFGKGNLEALNFLMSLGKRDGLVTKNVDNHAMHFEYGMPTSELIGVLAHIDVVPTSDKWLSNPFEPVIRDGRIYARGTIDDKGPLIATYYALRIIKESGLKISKRVRLICGCDEESGSRCLKHYFKTEEMPTSGFSPDAEFPLIYGEKGNCHFDIIGKLTKESIIKSFVSGQRYNIVPDLAMMTLKKDFRKEYLEFLTKNNYDGKIEAENYYAYGRSAHAMHPDKGLNASFILFKFLNEYAPCELTNYLVKHVLFTYFGEKLGINYQDNEMGPLTMNLGLININNNELRLGFDCRIPIDNVENEMKEKITKSLSDFPSLQVEFGRFGSRHYVSPDSSLVRTLMNAYYDVTNDFEAKPYTIGGGTYAKFIENAVAFGPLFPDREDVVHQDNEYIIIDDFMDMIKIYTKAIYELIK